MPPAERRHSDTFASGHGTSQPPELIALSSFFIESFFIASDFMAAGFMASVCIMFDFDASIFIEPDFIESDFMGAFCMASCDIVVLALAGIASWANTAVVARPQVMAVARRKAAGAFIGVALEREGKRTLIPSRRFIRRPFADGYIVPA
ncbi:hypothetical protein [Dyella sp. S184]|uniref:hypothetical protein n=1 Tax=Dyella sp. S184 TaxID=1641862 RepID=UPI00131B3492|nr:hypothetical protein [Dyella sp. S184]